MRPTLVIPFLLCVSLAACAGIPQALRPGVSVAREDIELAEWAVRTSYPTIDPDDESDTLLRLLLLNAPNSSAPRSEAPSHHPRFQVPVSAIAERRIAAYAHALHAWSRETGREIAAALDNQTGAQVGPVHQGHARLVVGPGIELALPASKDVTVLHTHPVHVSFSPVDVEIFLARPQVRRSVVIVPDGTIYLLERTPGRQDPARSATGRKSWQYVMTAQLFSELGDRYRQLGPSLNLSHTYPDLLAAWDVTNARFARELGYLYRRIPPDRR